MGGLQRERIHASSTTVTLPAVEKSSRDRNHIRRGGWVVRTDPMIWAGSIPLHLVCLWLGNSTLIAQEHYLMETEADFDRAAKTPTGKIILHVAQNPTQQPSEMVGNASHCAPQSFEKPGDMRETAGIRDSSLGDEGFEPPTSTV